MLRIHLGDSLVGKEVPPKPTITLKIKQRVIMSGNQDDTSKSIGEALMLLSHPLSHTALIPGWPHPHNIGLWHFFPWFPPTSCTHFLDMTLSDQEEEAEADEIANSKESAHDDPPSYELEMGEKCSNYVFCPEVHCHQILKLFMLNRRTSRYIPDSSFLLS